MTPTVQQMFEQLASRDEPPRIVVPGLCPICGEWALFDGWPPFRESFVCRTCYSTSRYRSLALGVLRAIREVTGLDAPALPDLPTEYSQRISLLDTQPSFSFPPTAAYTLPSQLAGISWIDVHTSSFDPAVPWGTPVATNDSGTTTNQTLEALTFADDSFDIVITSDVMEHVRLYERAHQELARVIRTGGAYIFTVPHTRAAAEHLIRVATHDPDDPTQDEYLLPPEYHGSASAGEADGVLSYRVFGTDIDRELAALGFDVHYSYARVPMYALYDTELFYCRRR